MKKTALLCLVLVSCGSTGGQLIKTSFRAGGMSRAAAGPLTFTTPQGWTVTLQTASIRLGPFYFNNSAPATAGVRSGVVIIEATEQVTVNPLDPTLGDVPGGADGETGDSLTCEVDMLPLPDPTKGGPIGHITGSATKGSTTVPFDGDIIINTSLVSPERPLVAFERVNAAAQLSFSGQSQAVQMRVDPRGWFDTVDFSALLASTPVAGNYTWTADNCASGDSARCSFQNALLAGVQGLVGVYQFSVTP